MNFYHVMLDSAVTVQRAQGGEASVSYLYVVADSFEQALEKVRAAHAGASVRQIQRANSVHGAAVIV